MIEDYAIPIILICVIAAMIGGAVLGLNALHKAMERDCYTLGENVERPTIWRNGKCFVEIAPGMLVGVSDIVYWLDHVEKVEKVEVESR